MSLTNPIKVNPQKFCQFMQFASGMTDIASHQFDQFLDYARCDEGVVQHALVDNRANPDKPDLEDVGMASRVLDSGVQCFSRVNWFTPDGMRGWGDGRTFITGTKGCIEIRKYFDFGRSDIGNLLILANEHGETVLELDGKVGFSFFGELIQDCLHRTEMAMTQHHAFQAARQSLEAQAMADAQAVQYGLLMDSPRRCDSLRILCFFLQADFDVIEYGIAAA